MTRSRTDEIGRGRSGVVYRDRDAQGREIARKVFVGDGASHLVLYILYGAPNPYIWCEDAVKAAHFRRRILASLLKYWFNDFLQVARTGQVTWNDEHRAYQLHAEFIDGHHIPLRQPDWESGDGDLVEELVTRVMKPLQRHLMNSGFDGLVWQAGLGNPVAANNFMLKLNSAARYQWVWIDLESGVPALFPMNILTLFSYYLPRCWKHRGWLFDDVSIPNLRAYLAEHSTSLNQALSATAIGELCADVDMLEIHQHRWKNIRRHHRGIEYALSKERLTAEKAEWFKARPSRWYWHLFCTGLKRIGARLAAGLVNALSWLWQRSWRTILRQAWLFVISQRFRKHRAHLYVARRIRSWRGRRFLDLAITRRLGRELRCTEDSEYITDFAVHLFIKPLIKGFQWLVIPLLYGAGILQSEILIGFLLVSGGAIGRTAYTTGRLIQATLSGQRRPWVALGVGMLPVVGNGAYPAQLILCSNRRNQTLARFVLYDMFASIGRHVPIWGGYDTLTEHWFNRLPDKFLARRYILGLREWKL